MRQRPTHGFPGFIAFVAAGAASVALAAQPPSADPAYAVRGRETVARQRELHARLERFHTALAAELRGVAPDLLPRLEPPPPIATGYQRLPRIVPDAPPKPPAAPQVVRYSWGWSDTLIAREMATLERLEVALETTRTSSSIPLRAAYEAMVADYKRIVDERRPIDADVDYNWLWQKRIAADRPLFDRLTTQLNAAVARQAQSDPAGSALETPLGFDPPLFVHIAPSANHQRVVTVPLSTDILDADVVDAFKSAIETHWRARDGDNELTVRLTIEVIPPERLYCGTNESHTPAVGCTPPAKGEHIDLATHVARFPQDVAVLTTGAPSLQLVAGRAIVLSPHDLAPRVLAHEFGHVLGFPDAYFRGYRDLGADGFQVMEFVSDSSDIMGAPGAGSATARHFERLIVANDIASTMRSGLEALYGRHDPVTAASRFRRVLESNPSHYGATLQLAKALDKAGKTDEALEWWTKILIMAEDVADAETASAARSRLQSAR